MQKQHSHTFADSERAAERLYWQSRAFDRETVAYVRKAVRQRPECCIDLGAGAGFLSRSLHQALECSRTVGIESSQRLVDYGQVALPPGLELLRHDVTRPLPLRGDLVVSRFLLTRLRNPLAALRTWRESEPLLVILEELAAVTAYLPLLRRYHELVVLVRRALGRDLDLGDRLGELAEAAGFVVESQGVQRLELPVPMVARRHALDLPMLRRRAIVREHFTPSELDVMQLALEELAAEPASGVVRVDIARCRAVLA